MVQRRAKRSAAFFQWGTVMTAETSDKDMGIENALDQNYTSTLADAPVTATDSMHFYKLRGPLLDQGRVNIPMSKTEHMAVVLKVYAAGGEGELHAHNYEDHSFVVLQGAARFVGRGGEVREIGRNEAVMIPAGTHYSFEISSEENLVLLRFSCPVSSDVPWGRSATDGSKFLSAGGGAEKLPAIIRDGEFFE